MAFIFMSKKGKKMKKLYLCCVFTGALALNNTPVWAQEATAQEKTTDSLLAQTLSQTYGAPVEVKIDEQNCEVRFPKVDVEDVVPTEENANSEPKTTDKDSTNIQTQVVATLPETIAKCEQIEGFAGMAQYQIVHHSADKLLAQIYNHLPMPFVKDVEFKSFTEEMKVVPQTGLVSGYKMHFDDAIYTETDATTGLKSQIGNLQDMDIDTTVSYDNDLMKYLTDAKFNNLNLVLPMMSMKTGSYHQAAEVVYKIENPQTFDYTNLLQNLTSLVSSRSRAVIKDVKMNIDMAGMGISFDMEVKSKSNLQDNGKLDTTGNMVVNNLQYVGDIIEKSKQPQSIEMDVSLNDVNMQTLAKLGEMQAEILEQGEDAEIDEEELINLLDEIVDTAKWYEKIEVKFADARAMVEVSLQRINNYLQGDGQISVNNLYNIFPELKDCRQNPKAPQCAQNPVLMFGSDLIDFNSDNPTSKIKFTDKGIFVNNKKVGEPMELDLHKLLKDDDVANLSADETADEEINLEDTEAAPVENNSIEEDAEAEADLEQFDLGEPLDIGAMMAQ